MLCKGQDRLTPHVQFRSGLGCKHNRPRLRGALGQLDRERPSRRQARRSRLVFQNRASVERKQVDGLSLGQGGGIVGVSKHEQ